MKKLLKYIIPIILAAIALISNAAKSDSTIIENQTDALSSEMEIHSIESSKPHSYLYLPNRTYCTNVLSIQGSSKRTSFARSNNFAFIKSGKIINTGIINLFQKKSLSIQCMFVKPASRLISLGKLII